MESSRAGIACALGLASLCACGAKTDLRAPAYDEVEADAAVADDVGPEVDACVSRALPAPPTETEAILLIDRSGSMQAGARDEDGTVTTRWGAMASALRRRLGVYQRSVAFGLWMFPSSYGDCRVNAAPTVAPARDAAERVNATLAAEVPEGGTPTWATLRALGAWLDAHPSPRPRSVVLVTDGGPNCNPDVDSRTCACVLGPSVVRGGCYGDPAACLDDVRTVDAVASLSRRGVPVYVVGFDEGLAVLTEVLDRMALAGGRPRMDAAGPRFYRVAQGADVGAAFDAIAPSITACAREAPSRPDDDLPFAVTVGGAAVSRDRSRVDGWDWADDGSARVLFFGGACARAAREPVSLRYGCR